MRINSVPINLIGFLKRCCKAGLVAALLVAAILAVPRPAAACSWWNPVCWAEETFDTVWDGVSGALNLAWDVITLDPDEAWDDFTKIAENTFCSAVPLTSYIVANGIEADFDECQSPAHAI